MNNKISLHKTRLYGLMLMALLTSTASYAELAPLSNEDLSAVEGQSTGVLLGLEMRLNQQNAGVDTAGALTCTGANLIYCRLGVQFNNVSDWLLFKGINGYIHIPQILLYGANLADTTKNYGTAINQSAIAVNIVFPNATNGTAIKVRNFGFTVGLALINKTFAATTSADNQAAYFQSYAANSYQNTNSALSTYSASAFDLTGGPGGTARETGIIGVNMNGNLNMGGTLYVFAK